MDSGLSGFLKFLAAMGYDPETFRDLPPDKQQSFMRAWDDGASDYEAKMESDDAPNFTDADMEQIERERDDANDDLAKQYGIGGHTYRGNELGDSMRKYNQERMNEVSGGMPSQLGHPDSGNGLGKENPTDSSGFSSGPQALPASGPAESAPGPSSQPTEGGDLSLYDRWKAQALKNPPRLVYPK